MRTLLALSAVGMLCACSHPADRTRSPVFGVSAEVMREAQSEPATDTAEAPEGSGAVGAAAQQRYQRGQTHPLLPATTSSANPSSN